MTSQTPPLSLPEVRGKYRQQADLSKTNWFGVGGVADVLFKPADVTDLQHFMQHRPAHVPVTVIGVGSNLIIRDGGIEGVVIRLGRGFTDCELLEGAAETAELESQSPRTDPHHSDQVVGGEAVGFGAQSPQLYIKAGAACMDLHVAQIACDAAITGLEFLSGIPGTIGGALAMNAGAYGAEIRDVLVDVDVVTDKGELLTLPPAFFNYSYRHAELPEGWIFVGCTLRGTPGDPAQIAARMRQIQEEREASQPIRSRTGGSTFRNPQGHKAWQLVDEAGCRGLRVGDAEMSQKHCNFIINHGNASAADLEQLGDEVRARVKAHSGVELTWEIKRIGRHVSD